MSLADYIGAHQPRRRQRKARLRDPGAEGPTAFQLAQQCEGRAGGLERAVESERRAVLDRLQTRAQARRQEGTQLVDPPGLK